MNVEVNHLSRPERSGLGDERSDEHDAVGQGTGTRAHDIYGTSRHNVAERDRCPPTGRGEQRGHDGRSITFGDAAVVQSPFLDEHDALSPAAGDSAGRMNSGRRTHVAAKNRGIVNSRESLRELCGS
jgi:hypothetical protein